MQTVTNGPRCFALVAAIAAATLTPAVQAAEFDVGDGKLNVSGSVFVGDAIRTVKQNSELLPNNNSSLVGIPGNAITPSTGRNQDDGNLNFNRGDAVSTPIQGYLSLDYKWHEYGAVASAYAWYDNALAHTGHPWGNIPNRYAAGQALSRFRLKEQDAATLPDRYAPAWTFLHGLKSPLSSTALRALRRGTQKTAAEAAKTALAAQLKAKAVPKAKAAPKAKPAAGGKRRAK